MTMLNHVLFQLAFAKQNIVACYYRTCI